MFHSIPSLATVVAWSLCSVGHVVVAADDHHHHPHHGEHHGGSPTHLHRATAPVGVMADHTHHAGGWMLSYRFMTMRMEGLRDGTDAISAGDILMPEGPYMMAAEDMRMDMHMLGAMYAPTDRITVMVMARYLRKEMTVRRRMPMLGIDDRFETGSDGIGDTSVTCLYRFPDPAAGHRVHVGLGLGLPTGSIDEADDTPMGDGTHLPYPMQLGSGTVDLLPSVTWKAGHGPWRWGAQAAAVLRLGQNDHGYTLGDRFTASVWGSWKATDVLSTTLRLKGMDWGDIDGSDDALPDAAPMMNPNADPDLRGGSRLELGFGARVMGAAGWAAGQSLALEVLVPIYERLDGPQMSTAFSVVGGWRWEF